jgi:hypothetical protein
MTSDQTKCAPQARPGGSQSRKRGSLGLFTETSGKVAAIPALNFGDCLGYALAIERDEPLLYKGNEFKHTDVRSALYLDQCRASTA